MTFPISDISADAAVVNFRGHAYGDAELVVRCGECRRKCRAKEEDGQIRIRCRRHGWIATFRYEPPGFEPSA